ncbi:hypothetical protein BKA70DRAFT_2687 [Coprinopsis sp. MPI-PUGE-AT-0042]|nr:hypothetical protein BKA70DRAFT_2687 [Coprinopsis sp. MPI-PUGE-AT-0042]
MFNNASTLEISGGTFASIGRDAYFGQLSVTAGGDVHISVAPTGNAAHLSHQVAATTRETKAHRRTSSIPTGPPDAFAHVETWLQALSHCLAPTSKKSFRTLRSHLKDIESLSTFSRTLYEISNDSAVERIIKQRIEMRLQRCGQMLQGIHRRIAALPCWWIFMIKFAYGEAFAEWLTSNGREPEELQSIQGELAAEVNSFGKCVRSMQHLDKWPWGPQMWCSLTAQTPFSTGLDTFLRVSGPSWIHDIVIEEIIILEPIKGSPWSVPLVFVETIEDIHGFLQTGSRNTISSHYIEGGQYQLNESETNATVDENSLPDFLRHKNVLEVTIRIRAPAAAQQDGCPGCGLPSDVIGAQQEGAWVRCACMMQYSQTLISQETGRPPSPTPRARKESGGDIDRLNDADWDASSKQGTSVSADVTEGMAASGRAQKTIEDRMLNPSFTPSTIAPPSAFRRLTIETVQFSPETQANIEVINDDGLDGGSVRAYLPQRVYLLHTTPHVSAYLGQGYSWCRSSTGS